MKALSDRNSIVVLNLLASYRHTDVACSLTFRESNKHFFLESLLSSK